MCIHDRGTNEEYLGLGTPSLFLGFLLVLSPLSSVSDKLSTEQYIYFLRTVAISDTQVGGIQKESAGSISWRSKLVLAYVVRYMSGARFKGHVEENVRTGMNLRNMYYYRSGIICPPVFPYDGIM
jgi:hypothetical protein